MHFSLNILMPIFAAAFLGETEELHQKDPNRLISKVIMVIYPITCQPDLQKHRLCIPICFEKFFSSITKSMFLIVIKKTKSVC